MAVISRPRSTSAPSWSGTGPRTARGAAPPGPTRSPRMSTRSRSRSPPPRSAPSSSPATRQIGHEGPGPRQLRLVHVQPRPVPGRAGRRDRHGAQRPGHRRGAPGARLRALRRLARAVHPERVRHLARARAEDARGGSADARRVPRPSGPRAGLRRARVPASADSRQVSDDRARRAHDLRRRELSTHRRALSLARGRSRAAGLPRGIRARGGGRDGCAPPRAARRGRAVPSRVGAHRRGQAPAGELPPDALMANAILTRAIDALAARRDLSADETAEVLAEIMHGEVSETQIVAFLIALRTKGETVEEIAGLARTMRELAGHVPTPRADLLDTPGGGGGRRTFNVSTTAALIAAGAGCAVAKHGNRSATSS